MSFQNNMFIHKDKDYSDLLMKSTFKCLNLEEENQGRANTSSCAAVFVA